MEGNLLEGWRVLDLTDHRGEVAAFVLAELGADVVKVEPPDGSPDRDDPFRFAAYNANKRSVALDLGSSAGRERFADLVAAADVVFDSGPPGVLAGHGIGPAELAEANRRVVHVTVTPFGLTGPRADQPVSELTLAALGGPMRLQGVAERAPVHHSVPQTWRHAGAEAAIAALVAHARMLATGEAQFVDVSAQSAMTWTLLNAMESHAIHGREFERAGAAVKLGMRMRLGWPAADGHVIFAARSATLAAIVPWLHQHDLIGPEWDDEDWPTWDHRVIEGEPVLVTKDAMEAAVEALLARHPKAELLDKGLAHGVSIAPMNTADDLLGFVHLAEREFWRSDEATTAADGRRPGSYVLLDGDRPAVPRPGPTAGADTEAVTTRWSTPRPAHEPPTGAPLPFDGVKVVDFSWVGVGPITAKCLADHGATVVRMESEARHDVLRGQPPFKDGEFGLDNSQFFGTFNTSKLSLSVDLKNEAGVEVARRMVQWADVMIESYTPGAIERLGLGPDDVRRLNPGIVMVSTSLLGRGGSYSTLAGYGYHAAAIAGYYEVVGWPDLPPDGPWLAYTDTIGPRFITSALLAALDRRRRTGEGVHIEAAQLEVALQLLAPELAEYQAVGTPVTRHGNRSRWFAPQGVYPCAGDDEWCAVTVDSDGAWHRLAELVGPPSELDPAELADAAGRQAHHDALDRWLSTWTSERSPAEAEKLLAAAGIPAGNVARSRDLLADPQYEHRGFYAWREHEQMGEVPYAGHQYRIAGYDHGPRSAAPCLGRHTFEVLTELAGLSPDEVADLAAAGALG